MNEINIFFFIINKVIKGIWLVVAVIIAVDRRRDKWLFRR